jgi:hypothetical protein
MAKTSMHSTRPTLCAHHPVAPHTTIQADVQDTNARVSLLLLLLLLLLPGSDTASLCSPV